MTPEFFDIHAHTNFVAYDTDRDAVVARAHGAGVWMINVGTEKNTSRSALALAEHYEEGVYATVGLHPIHVGGSGYHDKKELRESEFRKENFEWDDTLYRNLAWSEKVVAIGECGLDYFRCDTTTRERQKEAFVRQIHLANETGKPLMLHVRGARGSDEAYEDALMLLKHEARVRGNFHFFAGSLSVAKKIWDAGFSTSFTGVITFSRDYDTVVRDAPQELIMAETDCPYAAPAPYRGRRNEPVYVREVARTIARLRDADEESFMRTLVENGKRLFCP